MSSETLISIAVAVGGALVTWLVTWGALLTRVKVLEARVADMDEGRRAQGKRIGKLERWRSLLQGYYGAPGPRRSSQTLPVMPDDDSGSSDE